MMRYLQSKLLPYVRSTLLPSKPVQLLFKTGMKWGQDGCPQMAAALSYFALFSLFPMLLVIASILGSLIGPNTDAFIFLRGAIERFLPPEVHDLVEGTLLALYENSVGAGLIGFGFLLWTSSAVFGILRHSVNRIWRSPVWAGENGSVHQTVLVFVLNKLFSFLLVLGTALLLLTSLLSNIVIRTILELVANFQDTFAFIQVDELQLTRGLQLSSSFLILGIATGVLFKILPSARVCWGDVWLGALITTLLLVGLQQLVSNSVITIGARFLSYGVIGSVMILMLWIFLTCQIFLLGCVFSYVYAYSFGSRRGTPMPPLNPVQP
ncbi:MAG: YihY/virulence factor BrkB family protein [Synechococcales cyanobacterium C42_A2020_086]|jgi:membrane protein|nr:YihY/virulence factor BrkB family protein [Synechococcales cyanobacterium C42_A2020_086]